MKYAFNTFSCPHLSLMDALLLAQQFGYDGIEPRAGSDHQHGIELDTSTEERQAIRQASIDSGISIACLAVGCNYSTPSTTEQHIAETERYIDLAADVGATRLRVFGGDIPDGLSREEATELVVHALQVIAKHAAKRDLIVCMETHDSWSDPRNVRAVMERVDHPSIAVTWDVMHPVRTTELSMRQAYELIEPWVRHVHIHDGSKQRDRLEFMPMGTGDLDHRCVIQVLRNSGYQGFLSGEWIGWDAPKYYLPRELATLKHYEFELAGDAERST